MFFGICIRVGLEPPQLTYSKRDEITVLETERLDYGKDGMDGRKQDSYFFQS